MRRGGFKPSSLLSLISLVTCGASAGMAHGGPVNSNLLVNPSAQSGLTGWTLVNGGNGWAVSGESYDGDGTSFISSFSTGSMSQTIDLILKGFTAAELDAAPSIAASVRTKSFGFALDRSRAVFELKDGSGTVLASYDSGTITPGDYTTWVSLANTFAAAPVGTRQVTVTVYGSDGEFWAGQYGSEFDAASVSVLPEPTGLATLGVVVGGLLCRRRNRRA